MPNASSCPNARVVLNCVGPDVELVETRDPFDRAHSRVGPVKVGNSVEWGPMPAARVKGRGGGVIVQVPESRPRRYPRCQMTSQGVSFDSAYDGTHEINQWLKDNGLTASVAEQDPLSVRVKAASVLGSGFRGRVRL